MCRSSQDVKQRTSLRREEFPVQIRRRNWLSEAFEVLGIILLFQRRSVSSSTMRRVTCVTAKCVGASRYPVERFFFLLSFFQLFLFFSFCLSKPFIRLPPLSFDERRDQQLELAIVAKSDLSLYRYSFVLRLTFDERMLFPARPRSRSIEILLNRCMQECSRINETRSRFCAKEKFEKFS